MKPSALYAEETNLDSDAPIAEWSETDKSESPEIKPAASVIQTRAQKKKAADMQTHLKSLGFKPSSSAGVDAQPVAVDTQRTLEVLRAPPALQALGFSAADYEAFLDFMKSRSASAEGGQAPLLKPEAAKADRTSGPVVVGPSGGSNTKVAGGKAAGKSLKRKHDTDFDDVFAGPAGNPAPPASALGSVGSVHDNTSSPGQIRTYVVGLPDACEVNPLVVGLQPDSLKAHYASLPPLRKGVFTSWSSNDQGGNPLLSHIKMMCEYLNRPFDIYSGPSFATFTSLAFIRESHLVDGKNIGGKSTPIRRTKMVVANLFGSEFERAASFICNITNQPILAAQMHKNMLDFSTKREPASVSSSSSYNDSGETPTKKLKGIDTRMFASSAFGASPSKQAYSSSDSALPYEADVPVFDLRATTGAFRDCLDNVDSLPRYTRYGGEVAPGTIAVIGYHVSQYYNSTRKAEAVSLNLQWVMVLGDDEEVQMETIG
ncbi:hypothetical protein C8F01DRAFT_1287315 [Mycena amicta]|nr:hypothetical protein C8F01DRAFT_1287315 [Mycena amicta]